MKRLWAPWRIIYIRDIHQRKEATCVFCEAPKKNDEEVYIVYRGKHSYIIMNIYPYNTGHLLIAPYRHVAEIEKLKPYELWEMMLLTQAAVRGLKESLSPEGFNIGVNIGRSAGAGIDEHVHIHIVPRWLGDTNFMPILGNTKIIPQWLKETYDSIKEPIRKWAEKILSENPIQNNMVRNA